MNAIYFGIPLALELAIIAIGGGFRIKCHTDTHETIVTRHASVWLFRLKPPIERSPAIEMSAVAIKASLQQGVKQHIFNEALSLFR
jgi:hypothetical protein